MKKLLKLSPEYSCNPVWGDAYEGDFTYEELLDELGLTISLIQYLKLLQDMWDDTFVDDDPSSSGFKTEDKQFEFDIFALRLLWELHRQLPDYQISFYSKYFKQEVIL